MQMGGERPYKRKGGKEDATRERDEKAPSTRLGCLKQRGRGEGE